MSTGPGDEVRVDVEGRTLTLSNLDKVLYPRTGTTKGEVLHYYAQVAPVLLPQLADRAVTRIRWPHGVAGESFFEKNAPAGTPSWLRTVRVPTTGSRGESRHGDHVVFPVVDDLASLTWLVQLASLELHVHQWRVAADGTPLPADRLVVDLDPGDPAGLGECCQVALAMRELLAARGLDCRAVLSGSKGLHLYAPLTRDAPAAGEPRGTDGGGEGEDPAEAPSSLAKELAEQLARDHPQLVTATMTRARRRGKVFVDWSQNAGSKTTVAPYSLRGREKPTVAAPVTWAEVAAGAEDPLGLEQLTFTAVLDRVSEHGDLFA